MGLLNQSGFNLLQDVLAHWRQHRLEEEIHRHQGNVDAFRARDVTLLMSEIGCGFQRTLPQRLSPYVMASR